jgi:hypothetical protein
MMTHLEEFVTLLKLTPSARTIALLAAIAVPEHATATTLSPAVPIETRSAQQTQELAKAPTAASPDAKLQMRSLQSDAENLARDTFRFLDQLSKNPIYANIYAQKIPVNEKFEAVKQQLDADLRGFELSTNKAYSNLALFNDPAKMASLQATPGVAADIERVSETIDSIREVFISFRTTTSTGANRADHLSALEDDIGLAQIKLGSALTAIQQRYEASAGIEPKAPRQANPAAPRKAGFNI